MLNFLCPEKVEIWLALTPTLGGWDETADLFYPSPYFSKVDHIRNYLWLEVFSQPTWASNASAFNEKFDDDSCFVSWMKPINDWLVNAKEPFSDSNWLFRSSTIFEKRRVTSPKVSFILETSVKQFSSIAFILCWMTSDSFFRDLNCKLVNMIREKKVQNSET